MAKAKQARIVVKHQKDCDGVRMVKEGRWNHPWWTNGETVYLNIHGTQRGHHCWLKVKCNSTSCNAEGIVRLDALDPILSKLA